MAKQWTAGEILELSNAHWRTFALQAGVVLDLFTVMDNREKDGKQTAVADLAKTLQCDERSLGMLVTALIALGFLDRDGDILSLPEHSRTYLSRNSAAYVGFIIRHQAHIAPGWCKLADSVKTGGPARDISSSHTDDAEEREAFLLGMFNVAMNQAEKIAAALDLSGRKRLLDLGGGPGTYAVFFCRANPDLRATIYDRPTSEPIARGIVRRFGLEDRIDFAGGNFLRDPLPTGYDVVWISQIIHGDTPAEAAKLVVDAGKLCNPGGLLIIQDFVLDNDRRGPAHPALFALNMLTGTEGGQTYTWAEIEAMLRAAGAVAVSRLDIDLPMGCGILVGRMPG
ncbi:O-methyltransferase [uncultured delta proteobacterium]|uniref:O-methyltransferase n=1 Tax=uncultured delta proteobacterium TaxID=34034 RepID=A0A212KET2_9DELT|nr:O-methyltransferase [uncultured delta proteobacterium]